MYLFIEKGMTGGVSYIAKRFSKANNKYIQFYDDEKQSKYITYLDLKIYMVGQWVKNLPYSGFRWLNQKEIDKFDVNSISENSSIGYN